MVMPRGGINGAPLTYSHDFNRGKEHKTPWEIIHEKEPEVSAAICALPPVFLDELFMRKLDAKLQWGYDVIPHPYRQRPARVL